MSFLRFINNPVALFILWLFFVVIFEYWHSKTWQGIKENIWIHAPAELLFLVVLELVGLRILIDGFIESKYLEKEPYLEKIVGEINSSKQYRREVKDFVLNQESSNIYGKFPANPICYTERLLQLFNNCCSSEYFAFFTEPLSLSKLYEEDRVKYEKYFQGINEDKPFVKKLRFIFFPKLEEEFKDNNVELEKKLQSMPWGWFLPFNTHFNLYYVKYYKNPDIHPNYQKERLMLYDFAILDNKLIFGWRDEVCFVGIINEKRRPEVNSTVKTFKKIAEFTETPSEQYAYHEIHISKDKKIKSEEIQGMIKKFVQFRCTRVEVKWEKEKN